MSTDLQSAAGPRVPALEREPWRRAAISRTTTYELLANGQFPLPVKIGRASRWVSTEIDTWIADRITARDTHQNAIAGVSGKTELTTR